MTKWLIMFTAVLTGLLVVTLIGASRAEQEFPPVGEFAVIDGLRMHYLAVGEGPPVVLIHGASSNLRDYQASILQPLSRTHRVIAIDRPGHGYSERPPGPWPDPAEQARLIRSLLDQLAVEDPVLVGHSWSGSVVLAYLLAYPEEAAGGILLAGGSHPWKGGVAWYNDLAGIPVAGELFAWTLAYPFGRLALDDAVGEVFAPNSVPPDYAARTGVRLSLRPRAFLANAEDLRLLSGFLQHQSRRYAEIAAPLLLMTGREDDVVPPWNHAERLVRQAPNARLVVFDATGHVPHHVHTSRVVEMIRRFAADVRR